MNLEIAKYSFVAEAEGTLKALANRIRLRILCELRQGERTVTELHKSAGVSLSAASQHLGRLREQRIVAARRKSQTILYSLIDPAAENLLDAICTIYGARPAPAGARSNKRRSK